MIFVSQEKDLVNFKSTDPYFNKVNDFIKLWESGVESIEVQTSGSTGIPKKIHLSRGQILASVKQTKETFHIDERSLFICNLSIDFIAGKMMIIRALELSSELVVIPPDGDFVENLGNHKYTIQQNSGHNILSFVPIQIEKLLQEESGIEILNTARAILIGGAAVSPSLLNSISQLRVPVYATYGMTETVTHAAVKRINGRKPDLYYRALPGTELKLDERGCLCIKNEATENNWVITNDLAELISPTEFIFKGRVDDIINSGGIKLNLTEIDEKIATILKLKHSFFCHPMADEKLGQKLILFIESKTKDDSYLEILKKQLPNFEDPKEVIFVEEFIKTGSGKIDKQKTADASSISNK